MKVHQVIAKAVADHGVDTMFGVIGDGNLFLADSFVRDGGGRFVAAAHEAGAVLMALGHASVSGKVGVATVTHGPGLTNVVTPLVEGVRGGIPMVLLCGDTPAAARAHLQDIHQRGLVDMTGAGFEQLRSPQSVAIDVATAFRRAAAERRPVVLNMPAEFQWSDAAYEPQQVRPLDRNYQTTSGAQFDDAIGIIAAARTPVVLAGRGASDLLARASILRFAGRIGALLATTVKAKGLFDGEPFNLGICGTLSGPEATDLILQSDCVIAFGASLNIHTTAQGSLLKGKRLVQVDHDPEWIGRNAIPTAGLVGDPAMMADLFVHWLDEAGIEPSGFRSDEVLRRLEKDQLPAKLFSQQSSGAVDIREALRHIDGVVPDDRVLVTDGGRFVFEAWRSVRTQEPRLFVNTLNFGCIGLGMGAAIGAAVAMPDRTTLLVTGDGGFMLGGLTELNSAVRSGANLVVVVCNDASYGAEHVQFRMRDMDPSISLFEWPDFASLANALGGRGLTVRSPADLELIARALAEPVRPLLIDIRLDPEFMPEVPH